MRKLVRYYDQFRGDIKEQRHMHIRLRNFEASLQIDGKQVYLRSNNQLCFTRHKQFELL